MKWILIAFVIVGFVSWNIQAGEEESRQRARNTEQTAILVDLEKLGNSHVSQFVKDWRAENPEPSADELTTLKLTQAKIIARPNEAEQYTTAAKQKSFDAISEKVSSLGGTPKAKAGADN